MQTPESLSVYRNQVSLGKYNLFYVKGSKKLLNEAYFSLEYHSVVVSLGTYTLTPDMDMAFGGSP